MAKNKKRKKINKQKQPDIGTFTFNPDKINNQLMPIANNIEKNMNTLSEQYGFNLDFSFTQIKSEEIELQ